MEKSNPISSPHLSMASIQHQKFVLTSAEVLALNATPVELIPAPGAGKAIKLVDVVGAIEDYNSAAYATNVTLNLITDTADTAQFSNAIVLTSTANRAINFAPVAAAGATSTQIIENKSVKAQVATGNPATGNSPVVIYVSYSIIDVAAVVD